MTQRMLWPHQQTALEACIEALGHAPGYVQMPTGSGKSEVIRRLTMEWLTDSPHIVIIAVPNHALALQHRAGFLLYGAGPYYPTLLMQDFPLARSSRIIISTYNSLSKVLGNKDLNRRKTLLISDECHHCNALAKQTQELIYPFKNRIGFSATPWSEGCAFLFNDNLLYSQTLREAQNNGFLCNYEIISLDRLTPAPFIRWQMFFVRDSSCFENRILDRSVFYDDSVSAYRPYGNKRIIEKFRDGEMPCIYVNRMLLEGFDCPPVKHIYIDKETTSMILAMQMLGRGLRKVGSQVCRVFTNNSVALDTLYKAIERANNPERHGWPESI